MKFLIVLVNYNGYDLTIDCLQSLKPELDALPDARVALCDNGSAPGEAARLEAAVDGLGLRDRVKVTAITPNRGFTGGNNAVIQPELDGSNPPEVVFLLNNDTIVRVGAVQELVRFMESRPDVGLCGGRLEWPDGTTQNSPRKVLTPLGELERNAHFGPLSRLMKRWVIVEAERDIPHPCGWVAGASLAIRREVIEEVGLLDEGLYTYFDDVDYCLRAERAGWVTWYLPSSRIVHLIGRTTGVTSKDGSPKRRPDYWFQARRRYYRKNFGPVGAAMADAAAILGLAIARTRQAVTGKATGDPPLFLWDHLRHSVFAAGFVLSEVPNPAMQRLHNMPKESPSAA